MWLNRSTRMNSVTSTEPAAQTFARSLRARSTSIRCSACSLGSARSSASRSASASGVAPRGFDPAIGCVNTRPPCTFTSASGEEPTIQYGSPATSSRCDEVHVRARVQAAQHAIHVERVRRDLVLEPLRDDDLEHVAVVDVQLRTVDGAEEVVAFAAMARIGRARQVDVGEPRLGRLREALLHAVEARLRALPEGVRGLAGVVEHGGDELHGAGAVVDHDELGDERERLAGHPRFGRRAVRQVLDLPDRLPADEAHEPAGERRCARDVFGAPALEHGLEGLRAAAARPHRRGRARRRGRSRATRPGRRLR